MGGKDITEKVLEDHNDVFADIINAFVFEGKDVVHPDSLRNSSVHSQYKASDQKLHELERDVAKYWMDGNVRIALCGMENQTKVEKFMPFRVFSYDGTAYRSQLLDRKNKIVPVITIVLYFGNEHWTAPKSIKELLDIPAGLDEYVSDYNIHVFEIAWLTDEQIARFKSDFGIVARFFSERRKNPDYVPDDQTVITHVDAMLKLLAVMAGDRRYEEILQSDNKKEVGCMCDVAERLERKGIEKGLVEGRAEGQNLLVAVVNRLRNGETAEQIIASGVDAQTVALAQSIK